MGRGRSHVLLQAEPRDRQPSREDRQGTARHSEVGLRKECAGIRAGFFRFRTRPRLRADQSRARQAREAALPLRSLRRPGALRRDAARAKAAGNLHHRRRRAAQLVAAVRPVHRIAASAGRGRPAPEALSLRPAHLSGAGVLGRALGQSVQRSGFVGQVRASGRGRKVWRSVRRCDGRTAADRGGSAGTAEEEAGGEEDGHSNRKVETRLAASRSASKAVS